ncbi:MAG: hypothetical protein LW806_11970 [Planctomycetaceae bacterium]|nr:hypothetical protein [Planctomycetaceae bacterium]
MKAMMMTIALSAASALVPTGLARSESVTPPPPGLSVEPDAPVVSRRFLVQYQLFIYPAYRSWLASSNGEIDSLSAFTRFLAELPLTQYERFCYTQCYLTQYRR